ncbi:MAG: hypothetical protein EBT13_11310 [Rhodobacteraceae bacterium]|nr:hypothetical protein [Paracoccaceae bacterium]
MASETIPNTAADTLALAAHILEGLTDLAEARPGFEPGNYGSVTAYRSEARRATRDLHAVRDLARYIRSILLGSHTSPAARADMARGLCSLVGTGDRVEVSIRDNHFVRVDYCAGQYYPIEYRHAIARSLASAIAVYWGGTYRERVPMFRNAFRASTARFAC